MNTQSCTLAAAVPKLTARSGSAPTPPTRDRIEPLEAEVFQNRAALAVAQRVGIGIEKDVALRGQAGDAELRAARTAHAQAFNHRLVGNNNAGRVGIDGEAVLRNPRLAAEEPRRVPHIGKHGEQPGGVDRFDLSRRLNVVAVIVNQRSQIGVKCPREQATAAAALLSGARTAASAPQRATSTTH